MLLLYTHIHTKYAHLFFKYYAPVNRAIRIWSAYYKTTETQSYYLPFFFKALDSGRSLAWPFLIDSNSCSLGVAVVCALGASFLSDACKRPIKPLLVLLPQLLLHCNHTDVIKQVYYLLVFIIPRPTSTSNDVGKTRGFISLGQKPDLVILNQFIFNIIYYHMHLPVFCVVFLKSRKTKEQLFSCL